MESFEDRVKEAMYSAGGGAEGHERRATQRSRELTPLRRCDPFRATVRFFTRFKSFQGRAGRGEFWGAAVLVMGGTAWLQGRVDMQESGGLWTLLTLSWGAFLLPLAAAAVRRLHDIGKSGGLLLAFLIPVLITQIVIVFLLFRRGEKVANVYGPAGIEV